MLCCTMHSPSGTSHYQDMMDKKAAKLSNQTEIMEILISVASLAQKISEVNITVAGLFCELSSVRYCVSTEDITFEIR